MHTNRITISYKDKTSKTIIWYKTFYFNWKNTFAKKKREFGIGVNSMNQNQTQIYTTKIKIQLIIKLKYHYIQLIQL